VYSAKINYQTTLHYPQQYGAGIASASEVCICHVITNSRKLKSMVLRCSWTA